VRAPQGASLQAASRKHFRMILRNILKSTKLQATSFKQQAFDMKEIIGYKIVNKGEIICRTLEMKITKENKTAGDKKRTTF
jgi:hypothetical protein